MDNNLQGVAFSSKKFTDKQCRLWMKNNHIKKILHSSFDKSASCHMYMIQDPRKFKSLATHHITDGIMLVSGNK